MPAKMKKWMGEAMKRTALIVLALIFTGGIIFLGGTTDTGGQAETDDITPEMVSITYSHGDTQFEYNIVRLTGFDDSEMERQLNETLYHALTDWVNSNSDWLKDASIMLADNSSHYVTIKRSCESFGNRYDVLNIYVTLDMETGKVPNWEDLIAGTDVIGLLKERFPQMSRNELDDILQAAQMSNAEYIEYTGIENTFSALLFKPSFYISEDHVFLKHNSVEADDIPLCIVPQ